MIARNNRRAGGTTRKLGVILLAVVFCGWAAGFAAGADVAGGKGKKMKNYLELSEADLFAAMNLERPGLEKVKAAAAAGDWQTAAAQWGQYWAARQAPRYYVAPAEYAAGLKNHPAHRDIIVADADAIWSNDFRFATYKPARMARSFKWVDQEPDTEYIGFLYFFWLKNLGRAYVLTGDEKYAVMFREIVCSFWDATPEFSKASCGSWRGHEVLWNSGLGTSLRCVMLLDGYWLMRRSQAFTPELHSKMLRVFLSHARYIFATQMGAYTHSNFQASECAWLASAGVLFPEFREAADWRKIAVQRAKERIVQNFDADGAQLEQCPQYHLAGMRDLTRVLLILHVNGLADISGDAKLWKKMEQIYDYPVRITQPTGHLGVFNSGVYGTEAQVFFPLGAQLFDSKLQAWAAQRYLQPDFIPVAKGLSEYLLFMDGAWFAALDKARRTPLDPPAWTSELLKDSGLALLRSGWDEQAFSLIFDFNRQPWGGHAYNGRLSFDLFAYGAALVVNPGSTISYSMPEYSQWCERTIGHNTVLVGGSQSPRAAEFLAWRQGRRAVFVSAQLKGYAGFTHQRSIAAVPGEYFFIFDRLAGEKDQVPLAWLLHSPLNLDGGPAGTIVTPGAKPGLLIAPDSATREAGAVLFGKGYAAVPVSYRPGYQPLDAWRSDVPYLRINARTDAKLGGQTYGVLLAPYRTEPPTVEVFTHTAAETTRLQVHTVSIRWPDHADLLSVDYRKGKPVFKIERRDAQDRVLWTEDESAEPAK